MWRGRKTRIKKKNISYCNENKIRFHYGNFDFASSDLKKVDGNLIIAQSVMNKHKAFKFMV